MNSTAGTKLVGKMHGSLVHRRRVRILARMLAEKLSPSNKVLDIGCGDGAISALIRELVPGSEIQGVEISVRPQCKIPCRPYDGVSLPFADSAFDVCLFVDVLHHCEEISVLLREAARVSRSFVLLKDHLCETRLDFITLQLMDWVGNRPHNVPLPHNYQSRKQWLALFEACNLAEVSCETRLSFYPPPLSLLFGRNLHFISLLRKR
jgi:SAM-dependent methyltransferase